MQLRAKAAALMAAALLAAGCGSSSQGGSTSASTPPAASAASTPAATSASTAGTAQPASSSFASAGNCQQLAGLAHTFEQSIAAVHGGSDFQPAVSAFQTLANAAPSDIRPDLQVVAQALATYAASLAKLGLKPGVAPSPAQMPGIYTALEAFGAPQVREAGQHIRSWVHRNCGAGA